jgi:hypothetical protein
MRTIDYNPANNHEELAAGLERLSQNVRDKREELAANQLW